MEKEIVLCCLVALVVMFGFALGRLSAISNTLEEFSQMVDDHWSRTNRYVQAISRCFINAELKNRVAKREAKPEFDEEKFQAQLKEALEEAQNMLAEQTIGQPVKDFL